MNLALMIFTSAFEVKVIFLFQFIIEIGVLMLPFSPFVPFATAVQASEPSTFMPMLI